MNCMPYKIRNIIDSCLVNFKLEIRRFRKTFLVRARVLVFNATYSGKTSDLSQVTDKLYDIMLYLVHLVWARFTTLMVIGTDCIYSCRSNYHTIKPTTAPSRCFLKTLLLVRRFGVVVVSLLGFNVVYRGFKPGWVKRKTRTLIFVWFSTNNVVWRNWHIPFGWDPG